MRKLTGLLILLVCFGMHAFAQQTVSGKVTADSSNTPLDGVTVSLKDGKTATQTTKDGSFQINVPADAILVFSYIGTITKKCPLVASRT
jgi:GMP synthase-like glutamine amidotransferase